MSGMSGMSRLDIRRLMERYIGSSMGYLGTFGSHPDLTRFYLDCELDINPLDYQGTNKARFQASLENATPDVQAKIIRGILKRHPPDGSCEMRTKELHDEFLLLAERLETGDGVKSPKIVRRPGVRYARLREVHPMAVKAKAHAAWVGKPGECLFPMPLLELRARNELPELFQKVDGMDDHRLLGLVTGLIVENRVEKVLQAFLPRYKQLEKAGDAFTFSMKIRILESLNFIPHAITTGTHALRGIRNDFAHNLGKTKFSDVHPKFLRSLLGVWEGSRHRKAPSKDDESALERVFRQVAFDCIAGLDFFERTVRFLRLWIDQPEFVASLYQAAKEQNTALVKEIIAKSEEKKRA